MGNAIGIGKVAGDPRVCGIPGTVSAVRAEERRAGERLDKDQRGGQLVCDELEDYGHNRSSCNVLDSGRVRAAIRYFETSEGHRRLRRTGLAVLAIWCITSTALAIVMLLSIGELERVIEKLNAEVRASQSVSEIYK